MFPVSDEYVVVENDFGMEGNDYLLQYMSKEDFLAYIGDNKVSEYSLLKIKGNYIGFFRTFTNNNYGIKLVSVNIYVSNRLFSVHAILKAVGYIMQELKPDKIMFLVYGNNMRSLSLFNSINICKEGIYRRYAYVNGQLQDMHLYSILHSEFAQIREHINKKLC